MMENPPPVGRVEHRVRPFCRLACAPGARAALSGRRFTGSRARSNAAAAGTEICFAQDGFGALAGAFGKDSFNAVLCLGNSLPHVPDAAGLASALRVFSNCLEPGGLWILQNRNFDRILSLRERWMDPQTRSAGERERIFVRFYDFDPDGSIAVYVLTLYRGIHGDWKQRVSSARPRPAEIRFLRRASTRRF
ncbi:MAG: hypothetical protein JW929_13725 [Anaerolineales bacterium]|nr:hypothetical protein [Anaerolineales bacterium]